MKTPKGKGDTIGRRKKQKKIIRETYIIQLDLFTCLVIRSFNFLLSFLFPSFFHSFIITFLFFLYLYVLSLPSYFAAGLSHSLSPLHAFFFSHSDFSHLNFSRSFSATCLFLSSILILFSRSFTFAFIFHVHISYSFISDIIPFFFILYWSKCCIIYRNKEMVILMKIKKNI